MVNWRKLVPVYAPGLSGATLLSQGELFAIGYAHLSSTSCEAPHWHECYELGYVVEGCGIVVLGNREYAYQPGQVYIINDHQPHMGYASGDCSRLFVVHLHPAILDEGWIAQMMSREAHAPFSPDFGMHSPLIPLDDSATAPVRAALQAIENEFTRQDAAWNMIVGGLIIQAVGHLARRVLQQIGTNVDSQQREALKRISPILHMVEKRYADPISLDDMARTAYVSRSHCCALFQAALGTTPIAYRNARRLAEARRLLQRTDITVQEIAYRVGFSSVQEFNRLFRREAGTTPTQFRQNFSSSQPIFDDLPFNHSAVSSQVDGR